MFVQLAGWLSVHLVFHGKNLSVGHYMQIVSHIKCHIMHVISHISYHMSYHAYHISYRVHPAGWLGVRPLVFRGKNFSVGYCTQTSELNFFIPAMLIGTIDYYHFIPLSLTLTLPGVTWSVQSKTY